MNLPAHAYNPSILRYQGKLLLTCREHDRGDWRTSLHLAELGDDYRPKSVTKISMPKSLEQNSHEDARLFQWQNELWISWTCSQFPVSVFRCVVAMGKLAKTGEGWQIERYCIPIYGKNDRQGSEKNWIAFERGDALWSYYDTWSTVQTFIRLDGEKVVENVRSKSLPWRWGDIHGGAICPAPNGNLYHVFNSHTVNPARASHRYHIGIAELASKPPFDMLRISSQPVLYGEEGYCLNGHRWFKPSVVFACGAIMEKGTLVVSYGYNDAQSKIVKLKEDELW